MTLKIGCSWRFSRSGRRTDDVLGLLGAGAAGDHRVGHGCRTLREGVLDDRTAEQALGVLKHLAGAWTEVLPGEKLRGIAGRILMTHPLRAADALQLAAAVIWADGDESSCTLVCLDARLRSAARTEGFTVLPKTDLQAP
jgi:predicted nucleic acid-binding protein